MKTDEALAAEQALEAKIEAAGLDQVRRPFATDTAAATEEAPAATEPVAEEAPVAEAPAEAAETDAEPPTGDPVAAAVLAKYGNDPAKLAQAHAELQKKLGQQGQELGEHRQQSAEYERVQAELEEIKQRLDKPAAQPQFVDQATADWYDQQVETNPVQALEWARSNNTLLFQRGLATWKELDPFGAGQYATHLQIETAKAEMRETQAAQPRGGGVNDALATVFAQHPEYSQYANDLTAVMGRNQFAADAYTAAVQGGNQQQIEGAITTLFRLAEADTLRAIALSGGTPAEGTSTTDVATATTSTDHPDEAAKPASHVDAFREQFRKEAERYNGERAIPGAYVAR